MWRRVRRAGFRMIRTRWWFARSRMIGPRRRTPWARVVGPGWRPRLVVMRRRGRFVSFVSRRRLDRRGVGGGHVGSAGLSVHLSVTTGPRLAETAAKVSEPSCTLLEPIAKPISTAPAPAARATMPIVPAGSLGHLLIAFVLTSLGQCARGNDPGLSFDCHRRCASAPWARSARYVDSHTRPVTTPFASADY